MTSEMDVAKIKKMKMLTAKLTNENESEKRTRNSRNKK